MAHLWWDARTVFNRLRLKIVRERGLVAVREKLAQPEFHTMLLHTLEMASRADTAQEALAYVETWLHNQNGGHPSHALTQCWYQLKSILTDFVTAQARNTPSSPAAGSTTVWRTPLQQQKPTHHPPQSSSRVRGAPLYSSSSHTSHSSMNLNRYPLPPRNPEPQPHADFHPEPRQAPSSSNYIPEWQQSREIPFSIEDLNLPASSTEFTATRETLRNPPNTARLDSIGGPSLPSATSRRDSRDQIPLDTWWVPQAVVDSLKLRIERRSDALQLNLLLGDDAFVTQLMDILRITAPISDLRAAQQEVLKHLHRIHEARRPQESWLEQLWDELQPILTLKQRYSGSFDQLPSFGSLETTKAEVPTVPTTSKEDDAWDWEPENQEFKNFINQALDQIVKPNNKK